MYYLQFRVSQKNQQKINESAKIVSFEKNIPDKCHFAGQTQNLFDEHKI